MSGNPAKMSVEEFIAANKPKTDQTLDQHKTDIKRIIEEINRSAAYKYITEVVGISMSLKTFYKYCDKHFKVGEPKKEKEAIKIAPSTPRPFTTEIDTPKQTSVIGKSASSVQASLSRDFDLLS